MNKVSVGPKCLSKGRIWPIVGGTVTHTSSRYPLKLAVNPSRDLENSLTNKKHAGPRTCRECRQIAERSLRYCCSQYASISALHRISLDAVNPHGKDFLRGSRRSVRNVHLQRKAL
jgi:hypothetical protein